MENIEKTKKVKGPMNKDSLIIGIVIAVIVLLTVGIVLYYFFGVDNETIVTYDGGKIKRGEYETVYRYWAPQFAYTGYDLDSLYSLMVDQILLNKVLYEEAVEKEYVISEENKTKIEESFSNEDSIAALRSYSIDIDILKDFFYKNAVVSDYLNDIEENATTEQIKAQIIEEEGEDADLNLYNTRHILIRAYEDSTEEEKAEKEKHTNSVKRLQNLLKKTLKILEQKKMVELFK